MQRVDPFIPVAGNIQSVGARRPQPGSKPFHGYSSVDGLLPTAKPHPSQEPRQFVRPHGSIARIPADYAAKPQLARKSFDTVAPRPHAAVRPQPPVQGHRPTETQKFEAQLRRPSRTKAAGKLAVQILSLMILFAVGLTLRSVAVGQLLVAVYAVCTFVLKIESRTTFILALMSLGVVMATSLGPDTELANTFAVYAFLLLAVGTLSLGREVRAGLSQ